MPFNLPIFLTWLRIVAIPLLVVLYYLPESWMPGHERDLFATVLFMAAAFTDWLDGYLARRLNQTSSLSTSPWRAQARITVAKSVLSLSWYSDFRISLRSERRTWNRSSSGMTVRGSAINQSMWPKRPLAIGK